MATYSISAPDGQTYQIDGPAGASQAAVQAEVLRQHPTAATPPKVAPTPSNTPQPGLLDKALGSLKNIYGSFLEPAAAMATGAIAKPLGDVAGLVGNAANAAGLTDSTGADIQRGVQNTFTYRPQTEAGQASTGALGALGDAVVGAPSRQLGQLAGQGATALGASPGVSQGVQNGVQEALPQALNVLGARGGELPPADLVKPPAVNAITAQTLKETRDAGFMVTPTQAGDTSVTGQLASVSGSETKLQQFMSKFNSGAQAPKVAAQDIGITDGKLTPAAIAERKQGANAVYAAVKKVGPLTPDAQLVADMKAVGVRDAAVDKQFGSDISPDIDKLQARYSPKGGPGYAGPQTDAVAATNPANVPSPTQLPQEATAPSQMDLLGNARQEIPSQHQPMDSEAIVDAVRGLRADAKKLYTKGSADPEAARMADATQKTADALDDFLQRALVKNGQPNLADAFTKARTQLAKIKSVEDAYNPSTGSIDAASLAADQDRGVPLSGGLEKIANAYKAFPRSFQKPEGLPSGGPTILEQGALVGSLMHNNWPLAMGALARPIARARVASTAYQDRIAGAPAQFYSGAQQAPAPGFLQSLLQAQPASALNGLRTNPQSN